MLSKSSNRKPHGGLPELGCIRKIYDKNSHRHTLNLVVAARDHPLTVNNLELALFNLQVALDDAVKRVHVPLDMRILKAIDKMSVVLAFVAPVLALGCRTLRSPREGFARSLTRPAPHAPAPRVPRLLPASHRPGRESAHPGAPIRAPLSQLGRYFHSGSPFFPLHPHSGAACAEKDSLRDNTRAV